MSTHHMPILLSLDGHGLLTSLVIFHMSARYSTRFAMTAMNEAKGNALANNVTYPNCTSISR